VDLALSPAQAALRDRAREFVVEVLRPLEIGFEQAGGHLEAGKAAEVRRLAIEAGLAGGELPESVGGKGWSAVEQVLVHEQYGQVTGGLWSFIPGAYDVLRHADAPQRTRYLEPSLRGERFGAYAVTEPNAGSDARTLETTATRDGSDWVISGEKWFVTGPDNTDFMVVQAMAVQADADTQRGAASAVDPQPTLFLVDYDAPGLIKVADPDYMHTFADRHPQFRLDEVRVPDSARLGPVGAADELTNDWFVTERIHIGARCAGAMERLLTLGVEWATGRVQFGERIYDFEGVSFPLANSAADASAARLLTREAAWLADTGTDRKVVHAKASVAKLFASEAAFTCADRVLQVFGGRGYMRDNPAERYLRELRVDRIWEGTSEIQRLIIARSLERRGVDRVVG
jgi:acyl-CoA dehydrogenase